MAGEWAVYWDNGHEACGTFAERYDTEDEAEAAAEHIFTENCAEDVWDADEASCEAIRIKGEA